VYTHQHNAHTHRHNTRTQCAGLFSLADAIERSSAATAAAIGAFALSLLLPAAAAAAPVASAALAVTFVLSGIPQLAETIEAVLAGKLDTHVLMSLSAVGCLYMGLAQEVSESESEVE
jgi:hypothetical protein